MASEVAVQLAGPYLAILSVLKLVLLIMVFSEVGKALGKSGRGEDHGGDHDAGVRPEPEEEKDIEIDIISPVLKVGKNYASIKRKNNTFSARVKEGHKMPRGGRYVWLFRETGNAIANGSYFGGTKRNWVEKKGINIPKEYVDGNEYILMFKLLDSSGTRVLSKKDTGSIRVKIEVGPGPGPGPGPTRGRGRIGKVNLRSIMNLIKYFTELSSASFVVQLQKNNYGMIGKKLYLRNSINTFYKKLIKINKKIQEDPNFKQALSNDELEIFNRTFTILSQLIERTNCISEGFLGQIKGAVEQILIQGTVNQDLWDKVNDLETNNEFSAVEPQIQQFKSKLLLWKDPIFSLAQWCERNKEHL